MNHSGQGEEGGHLGALLEDLGVLGGVLGPSWEPSWSSFGGSWGPLGAFGALVRLFGVGVILKLLWGSRGPLGVLLGLV